MREFQEKFKTYEDKFPGCKFAVDFALIPFYKSNAKKSQGLSKPTGCTNS